MAYSDEYEHWSHVNLSWILIIWYTRPLFVPVQSQKTHASGLYETVQEASSRGSSIVSATAMIVSSGSFLIEGMYVKIEVASVSMVVAATSIIVSSGSCLISKFGYNVF